MPKRLSDVTHQYERSCEDLEDAQDCLTTAIEAARDRVQAVSAEHRIVTKELRDYLYAHQNEIVIASDFGYHYDATQPGSIKKRPVFWSHHIWVEDVEPKPEPHTYRVPPPEMNEAAEAKLTAMVTRAAQTRPIAVDQTTLTSMATAWGDVEPEDRWPAHDAE